MFCKSENISIIRKTKEDINMAKKSQVLLDEVYPIVESKLSSPENTNKLRRIIGRYIDRNSESLSAIGPTRMIVFTENDKNLIYEIFGIEKDADIQPLKRKITDNRIKWRVFNQMFTLFMPLVIRFYQKKKDKDMVMQCIIYMALSIYPMLYYKYWKHNPNENIMNYTINELSNKYKVKQLGSLLAAITDTAYGAYVLHQNDIDKGYDDGLISFSLSMRTRLNSFLNKISAAFYDNHKHGRYLNTEYDDTDPDNFHESNSSIYEIQKIVDSVAMKLVVNGPNIKLITISAKNNQVSVNELRNYISTMLVKQRIDEIKAVIEAILFIYTLESKNTLESINSTGFLIYCLDIYKRSNTTNENVIKIKKILDGWLEDLGTYKKTQRSATINNFRRALYTFFVISIQDANIK